MEITKSNTKREFATMDQIANYFCSICKGQVWNKTNHISEKKLGHTSPKNSLSLIKDSACT